jgi:hypothetical protein
LAQAALDHLLIQQLAQMVQILYWVALLPQLAAVVVELVLERLGQELLPHQVAQEEGQAQTPIEQVLVALAVKVLQAG